MSSKTPKTIYLCQQCGAQFYQWAGYCTNCRAWNSLVAETSRVRAADLHHNSASNSATETTIKLLTEVAFTTEARLPTMIGELDRVLGGGLVPGAVILIGGDPGIGKSTLILQTMYQLSQHYKALYVTGEESLQQVALRAQRLKLSEHKLYLLAETNLENILQQLTKEQPQIIAIDSIQTLFTESIQAAAGGVSQVRESAAQLVQFAKQSGSVLFIIGHVTKEGALAGPRVLEHMVDCVLYFESEQESRYRIIRTTKNRFGTVNELGIFAMTDHGLKEILNPSSIFLSHYNHQVNGSAIMVTLEGSRPLLIEIQALIAESHAANPRRVTVGVEQNRLALLLAILHRHGKIATYNQDIFINIVGGIDLTETAVDLPLLLAVLSSIQSLPLPLKFVAFGEIGLAGEIRPVQHGQERIKAAIKHGFTQLMLPRANAPKNRFSDIELIPVNHLTDALQWFKKHHTANTS